MRWHTTVDRVWERELSAPKPGDRILLLRIRSSLRSFLRIYVDLVGNHSESGCRHELPMLIEWEGVETVALYRHSFRSFGKPQPEGVASRIRFTAIDSTFEGTKLEFLSIAWAAEAPLVRVNEQEYLLENFQSPYVWDIAEWKRSGEPALPVEDCGLSAEWAHARLSYVERANRSHRVSYEKSYNLDLSPYQALLAFLSTDRRTRCSIWLQIDGRRVALANQRAGRGTAEEFRTVVDGSMLEKVIVELQDIPALRGGSVNQTVGIDLRWIMLERKGADPAASNEVRGIEPIPSIQHGRTNGEAAFPFGFVLDQIRVEQLKQQICHGAARQYFAQILAEADRYVDYRPEPFVGAYVPVDIFGRGINRVSAPGGELYKWISCMVNSSLVYAITGEIRYADSARRALLSAAACDYWSAGLFSRYPKGLPVYRHPMVDSHVMEAVALCYDIIYPLLADEERERVEDAAFDKMVGWGDQILRQHGNGYLLTSNQGPIFFLGFLYAALLSRRRHPEAEKLIERHLPLFFKMLERCCRPDGSTNEGILYWVFGMQSLTTAMLVVSRCLGIELDGLIPDSMRHTMDFLLHMRSTSGKELNFIPISDGNHKDMHRLIGCPLLFFARHLQDDRAYWLWQEWIDGRAVPLYFGNKAGSYSTQAMLSLVYLPGERSVVAPVLPAFKRFSVCDRLFVRAESAEGEMLLFIEGGPQTYEHTHYDKGQFVLEVYGETLASDPGMIDYADPFSHELQRSVMHNVITIRGKNQSYKDPQRAVLLKQVSSDERVCRIEADLSNSYSGVKRYTRIFICVKLDYVLIMDDLDGTETGLEWNFHSQGRLEPGRKQVRVEAEKAGMVMAFGCTEELVFQTTTSEKKENSYVMDEDDLYSTSMIHHLIVSPPANANRFQLAALLVPYPVETRQGYQGVRIPAVQVRNDNSGMHFDVEGRFGRDHIHCSFEAGGVVGIERLYRDGRREVILQPYPVMKQ